MRRIGEFDQEKSALKFWSFLKGQGIDSTLEKDDDDQKWSIWVAEEDKIDRSIEELRAFLADPEAKKFISIASNSVAKTKDTENEQKHPTKRKSQGFKEYNLRERWGSRDRSPGVLTLSLIITCVAVFLLSGLGKNTELVGKFFISEKLDGQLSEFISGQIWRIFTPIFLHFNFLHIAFNMLWLHDLGSQIEKKKGPKHFISFVLILAAVSNLAQFLVAGPAFGGMSGVVYGLFGYVWVKCKYDPGDGFFIDSFVAIIMFGFFIACFIGVFGGVANWAHAGGLIVGLAWGYGSALRWNLGKS